MPAAEVVDQVDERNQAIGTVARADVFKLHANFRVAHVFIFNSAGELLLQKLALNRIRHPGCWGSSLAAYVAAGESYSQAAIRRLREELGIYSISLQEIGRTQMFDEGCRKFITLYAGRCDGPFTPDPSHIAELEFVLLDRARKTARQDHLRFTPTFLHLLDFYTQTWPS
jgi:isopentenyl-diphosphate Delta-isomerase